MGRHRPRQPGHRQEPAVLRRARGPKDDIAATSGKPTSPNLVVLHATADEAKKASSENAAMVAATPSKTSAKAAARRTPASKRSKARR